MLHVDIDSIVNDFGECILQDIHFSLPSGSILGVVGPTGIGKTTLLKIIAGVPKATDYKVKAKIHYDNIDSETPLYRNHIGFGFQESDDQFLLNNVKNEVYLPLDDDQKKIADSLFLYFDVVDKVTSLLKDLSTGQRKIVSLIATFALGNTIRILDEPSSNLDRIKTKHLYNYLNATRGDHITIIASHDKMLNPLYDKILFYNEGKRHFTDANSRNACHLPFDEDVHFSITPNPLGKILVSLQGVSYTYPNGHTLLDNLNFTIRAGEFILVNGDNGTGKSTLLKLLTRRLSPSKGKISIDYYNYGMVVQEPEKQLFATTVLKEIYFDEQKQLLLSENIEDALKTLGLSHHRDTHPYFLSRGQKQLLLVLAIMHKQPSLLIIDEPFTGLDRASTEKLIALLQKFYHEHNCTIILTSHSNDLSIKSARIINITDFHPIS